MKEIRHNLLSIQPKYIYALALFHIYNPLLHSHLTLYHFEYFPGHFVQNSYHVKLNSHRGRRNYSIHGACGHEENPNEIRPRSCDRLPALPSISYKQLAKVPSKRRPKMCILKKSLLDKFVSILCKKTHHKTTDVERNA